MARKSLRPYLNQIRAWTRQGRTDAWVAHQLEVSVQEVQQFKSQNELAGEESTGAPTGANAEEIDLRAADEALIAAELEAAQLETERAEQERAEAAEAEGEQEQPRARRRTRGAAASRRAGRRQPGPIEGTFDHGEEGYGLWLDPAVRDDPIYAEHWAGHRPIQITIEENQIVITRLQEEGTREEEDQEE